MTSAFRTNYFRVTDANALRAIVAKMYATDDESVFCEMSKDTDKQDYYMFGAYGKLEGVIGSDGEPDFDAMIHDLQQILADDDAILIFESGHHRLRSVYGHVTVITKNNVKFLEMEEIAKQTACDMLQNAEYNTECDY